MFGDLEWDITWKEHEGIFQRDRNILYCDKREYYTGMTILDTDFEINMLTDLKEINSEI